MGLCDWGLLIYCIFSKKSDRLRKTKLQVVSLALCSGALYMPIVCQYIDIVEEDYATLIDCANAYHTASVVLLLVTLILNIIASIKFIIDAKKEN